MSKVEPLRQCTGCGEMKPKKELVRIVKTPTGEILLDHSGKVSGRGTYVCHNPDCYKKAVKARRFEKAFSVKIPDEVSKQIVKELEADEK